MSLVSTPGTAQGFTMKIRIQSTNKIDRAVVSFGRTIASKTRRTVHILRMNAVQTFNDLKDDRKEVLHG